VAHPPVVHSAVAKLARSEIAGVNAHTIPIALDRAEREHISFADLNEREVVIMLLQRISYPESAFELSAFLNVNHALTPTTLSTQDITDLHAQSYMTWLAGFLNDPEPNMQKNSRILLRWLVANRGAGIREKQQCLAGIRRIADEDPLSWKNAAFIVYALGMCGTIEEDYDRVIQQSELVIEHDKEHADMVAESLYHMYPPALINALQYFIEHAPANSKQFSAGIHLLAKVTEIEDKQFWNTYFDDMDRIVKNLTNLAGDIPAVERILDRIEKHLAMAGDDE
jgi:hypothetical protein